MRLTSMLALAVLLGASAHARAQDAGTTDLVPSVTVRGDGLVRVKPDFARLVVTVSSTGASLKEASNAQKGKAAQALSLLEGLKNRGVRIERSDVTLEQQPPQYSDGKPDSRPEYAARTRFVVRIDALKDLDSEVTALVESGLLEISSSAFEVKDSASALDNARRLAILAARRSAQAYADAGAFKLLDLQKALDVTPQSFSGLTASTMAARSSQQSVALVPPATLTFHASVVATWRIGRR